MKKTKVKTGQKYGMLTVISRIGSDKKNNAVWLCKCDCGENIERTTHQLVTNKNKSCGCFVPARKQKRTETIICVDKIDELRAGVTLQAVNDYRKALIKYKNSTEAAARQKAEWVISECEAFFTDYGDYWTFGHGVAIMEQIRKEVDGIGCNTGQQNDGLYRNVKRAFQS